MSTDTNKTTTYELPTGAVTTLEQILGTGQWYKDDPQQGKTLVRAVQAVEAFPECVPKPVPTNGDLLPDGEGGFTPRQAFLDRIDAWATVPIKFEWYDKHKEVAKKCVSYYLKQASFVSDQNAKALLLLLGLDDGYAKVQTDDDPPQYDQYELRIGSIALLDKILRTPQWYKDSEHPGKLLINGADALSALPKLTGHPERGEGESNTSFDARADAWAAPVLMFRWQDKHKEAAKRCMSYYLKKAAFAVNPNTAALIRLFKLDDE